MTTTTCYAMVYSNTKYYRQELSITSTKVQVFVESFGQFLEHQIEKEPRMTMLDSDTKKLETADPERWRNFIRSSRLSVSIIPRDPI